MVGGLGRQDSAVPAISGSHGGTDRGAAGGDDRGVSGGHYGGVASELRDHLGGGA